MYSISTQVEKRKKIYVTDFISMKKSGKKISCITCYDASFSRIIEKTPIDLVLVGDSLANVIQGKKSTLNVSINDVAYHVKCVASSLSTPVLVADMPFASYGVSLKETVENAAILMKAGAEAVKLEGATDEICDHIRFLTSHGIPVIGHIGLMPQSVNAFGGYKIQGKNNHDRERLSKESFKLQRTGCCAIVLELVEAQSAISISQQLEIPTISIGAGNYCDGNILVLQDMLGMNNDFKPKFLKHFAKLEYDIHQSVVNYCKQVQEKCSEPQENIL